MTWSISASGPKDNVLNKIETAAPPNVGAEVKVFRAAQEVCRWQLEAIEGDSVTVMASGSATECSVHVGKGAKVEEPKPKAKAKADHASTAATTAEVFDERPVTGKKADR